MDYELMDLLDNGTTDEIGDYLSIYGRQYWNGKCYEVNDRYFYPIWDDGILTGWEED